MSLALSLASLASTAARSCRPTPSRRASSPPGLPPPAYALAGPAFPAPTIRPTLSCTADRPCPPQRPSTLPSTAKGSAIVAPGSCMASSRVAFARSKFARSTRIVSSCCISCVVCPVGCFLGPGLPLSALQVLSRAAPSNSPERCCCSRVARGRGAGAVSKSTEQLCVAPCRSIARCSVRSCWLQQERHTTRSSIMTPIMGDAERRDPSPHAAEEMEFRRSS